MQPDHIQFELWVGGRKEQTLRWSVLPRKNDELWTSLGKYRVSAICHIVNGQMESGKIRVYAERYGDF